MKGILKSWVIKEKSLQLQGFTLWFPSFKYHIGVLLYVGMHAALNRTIEFEADKDLEGLPS
jgi:hypothetical protein